MFGLGWFGLNLVPVLGLVPMAYLRIAWVADHFAYLSLAGAMGLVAAGLGRVLSTAGPFPPFPRSVRAVVGVGTAVAVAALALATASLAAAWAALMLLLLKLPMAATF